MRNLSNPEIASRSLLHIEFAEIPSVMRARFPNGRELAFVCLNKDQIDLKVNGPAGVETLGSPAGVPIEVLQSVREAFNAVFSLPVSERDRYISSSRGLDFPLSAFNGTDFVRRPERKSSPIRFSPA